MIKWVKLSILAGLCLFFVSGCAGICCGSDDAFPYIPRHKPGGLDEPLMKGMWEDEVADSTKVLGQGWPWSVESCWTYNR